MVRQRQGVVRERGRSRPVVWLDPVAASPIEVAVGTLLLVVLGLVAMVWGAAAGSSWLAHRDVAPVGISDAAVAMVRLGASWFSWDGAWEPELVPRLGNAEQFWFVFALEALAVGLLFWPVWRLVGPRPGDPLPVYIEPTPVKHPRTERRRVARAAAQAARDQSRDLAAAVAPADRAAVGPAATKILTAAPDGNRLVLGRVGRSLVATENHHSVIVFGPTRSGKTSAFTVPAVLEWDGPAVICTTKADVVTTTWDHRASLDAGAWLVDPMATMRRPARGPGSRQMMKRYSWSPLQVIEEVPRLRSELDSERRAKQWMVARRTAQWMVRAAGDGAVADRVDPVLVLAEQLLAPLLLAAASEEVSMGQVGPWLDRPGDGDVDLALERTGVPEAVAVWHGTRQADPGLMAAARRHLAVVLYTYSDPTLSETRDPEFNVRHLLDGRANTLYLLAPPQHGERLRPLLATLVAHLADAAMSQAAGSATGRLPRPLLIVVDDAVSCLPAAVADQLASTGAGVGVQLLSVFSDLGQLERVFGRSTAIQVANSHRARVVLPGINDGATLRYVTGLISGNRLLEPGEDGLADGPLLGESVTPLRTLGDGEAICVYGNLPPIRLQLRPWYSEPGLRARVEPESGGERRRLRAGGLARLRRLAERGDSGAPAPAPPGFPDPFDAEANNREAARYWEAVMRTGTLPDNPPPGQSR